MNFKDMIPMVGYAQMLTSALASPSAVLMIAGVTAALNNPATSKMLSEAVATLGNVATPKMLGDAKTAIFAMAHAAAIKIAETTKPGAIDADQLAQLVKPECIDVDKDKDKTAELQTSKTQENNRAFMCVFSPAKVNKMAQSSSAVTDILIKYITKGKTQDKYNMNLVNALHKGCENVLGELTKHSTHMKDFVDTKVTDAIQTNLFQGCSDNLASLNFDSFLNFFNRNEYYSIWHTYTHRMNQLKSMQDKAESQALISSLEKSKTMFMCPDQILHAVKQHLGQLDPTIGENKLLKTALSVYAFAMYASLVTNKENPSAWAADAVKLLSK